MKYSHVWHPSAGCQISFIGYALKLCAYVLLGIPFNKTEINNIYCLDAQARLIWQSEDLSIRYPALKNLLPYEQMGIKDDTIFASDFYGRNYKINVDSGKIEEFDVVK